LSSIIYHPSSPSDIPHNSSPDNFLDTLTHFPGSRVSVSPTSSLCLFVPGCLS
jgi:hypothetical protein